MTRSLLPAIKRGPREALGALLPPHNHNSCKYFLSPRDSGPTISVCFEHPEEDQREHGVRLVGSRDLRLGLKWFLPLCNASGWGAYNNLAGDFDYRLRTPAWRPSGVPFSVLNFHQWGLARHIRFGKPLA